PALSGHADAGDIVLVYDNNKVIGSATAASNGTWSFTPATALNDGSHSFTTVVKDAVNGHTSAASAAIHFTVDTHIAAPVITGATDDVGPRTGEISNGGTTDDSRPVMHGTAEAGATVNIYDGNNELRGQSIADSHGNWSVELAYSAVNITAGARNYYAVAESGSGATSAHSNSWLIWYAQETPTAFAENFNELQNQAFSNSAVYQLAHFDVSVAQHGNTSAYSPGFNDTHYGVSRPVSSRAMTFTEGTKVTLDMHNPVSDISFKIGDLTTNESLSVTYYDAHGSALHTEVHAWVEGLLTTAHYTAPAGSYIDSVQMSLTNPGYVYSPIQTYVWIDDISGHYYPHAATQSAQLMAMPLMQEAEFVQADTHQVSAEVTLAGLYDGAHVQHATVVLNGNGQQTLSLTAEDILSNAQTDLFIHDGRQQLAINGDKGDVVELKVSDLAANGQWHDAGQ
ncbi:hypothetical protein FH968_23510, partial [Buttiauxella sp. B2]|uniref:Ig-like domain-containing protein n=1 Tax=Buttiauxella sp. B2 TaxID=2587812 RepID=UPI001120EC8B